MKLCFGFELAFLAGFIVCLSDLASSSGLEQSQLYQTGLDWTKLALRRWKRQALTMDSMMGDDSMGCVMRCLTTGMKGLNLNDVQNQLSGDKSMCEKFKKDELKSICKTYEDSHKCLIVCVDGAMKNTTLQMMDVLKFLCVDRRTDFDNALPCISSACPDIERQCKPSCDFKNETKQKLSGMFGADSGGNNTGEQQVGGGLATGDTGNTDMDMGMDMFGDLQKMMSDVCQSGDCFMKCSKQPLTAKCGSTAYELQAELMRRSMSTITNAFKSFGMDSLWPKECQALGAAVETSGNTSNITSIPTTGVVVSTQPMATTTVPATFPVSNNTNITAETKMAPSACVGGPCDRSSQQQQHAGASTIQTTVAMSTISAAIVFYHFFY